MIVFFSIYININNNSLTPPPAPIMYKYLSFQSFIHSMTLLSYIITYLTEGSCAGRPQWLPSHHVQRGGSLPHHAYGHARMVANLRQSPRRVAEVEGPCSFECAFGVKSFVTPRLQRVLVAQDAAHASVSSVDRRRSATPEPEDGFLLGRGGAVCVCVCMCAIVCVMVRVMTV